MFCDCGCMPCWTEFVPHAPCSYFECEERRAPPPDARKVIGGKPGREIILID